MAKTLLVQIRDIIIKIATRTDKSDIKRINQVKALLKEVTFLNWNDYDYAPRKDYANKELALTILGEAIEQSSITELRLSGHYNYLAPFLNKSKIKILQVYPLNKEDIEYVIDLLPKMPATLESLNISFEWGGDAPEKGNVQGLIDALPNNLNKLSLIHLPCNDENLAALVKKLPLMKVKELDLTQSQFSLNWANILAPCLQYTNLIKLNLSHIRCPAIGIHSIDLRIDLPTMKTLVENVQKSSITELDLNYNYINAEATNFLFKSLKDLNLKKLGFKIENYFADEYFQFCINIHCELPVYISKSNLEQLTLPNGTRNTSKVITKYIQYTPLSVVNAKLGKETRKNLDKALNQNRAYHHQSYPMVTDALKPYLVDDVIGLIHDFRATNPDLIPSAASVKEATDDYTKNYGKTKKQKRK